MEEKNSSLYDTAINEATGIFASDLSEAEIQPIPYLNRLCKEEIVMDCIQLGDINLMERIIRSRSPRVKESHVGTLSKNALNQMHYLGVVAVALASRASICGGVPESIAMALGDSYIQQIDQVIQPEHAEKFYFEVFRGFCKLVHENRISKLSVPVRQCCDYMLMQMYTNVTLEELAEICHLSPNYVSDLFRKEIGMGAIQYFHLQKVNFAAYLLKNTSLPVAEIAAQLSYCSQSNFTQKFKKAFGKTPAKYRADQIQKFPGQTSELTRKILKSLQAI